MAKMILKMNFFCQIVGYIIFKILGEKRDSLILFVPSVRKFNGRWSSRACVPPFVAKSWTHGRVTSGSSLGDS